MADYSPYVPGYMAARSVWDQGIAPLAGKVQGFLKGTAGLPGAVKDYAVEAGQSESGLTTQLGVDAFKLLHAMREGIKEDPLRAIAEMYPPVGAASDLFETNQLLDMAQNAEEAGDLEKAQTLRELANTIVLMGIIPGGPPAKRTIDQKLKEMAEKRRKLKEETGLPYVPNKDAPLPEGRRGDPYDPELDVLESQKRIEEANLSSEDLLKRGASQNWNIDTPLYHYTRSPEFPEFKLPDPDTGRSAYGSSAKGIESTYGPGVYTSTSPTRYGGKSANTNVSGWRAQHSSIPEDMRAMTLFSRGKIARPLEVQAAEAQIKAQIENGTRRGLMEVDPNMPGNWRHQYWSDIHQVLKDQGFTGLQINEIVLIFDPKNLRDVKARFDPAKAGSADLLSGIASIGAMEGIT